MKYNCIVVCVALCILRLTSAQSLAVTEVQIAQITIASSKEFAMGPVGFGGEVSNDRKALEILVKSPDALQRFVNLSASSNPVAKLYALVGLRRLSAPQYKDFRSALQKSRAEVQMASGCLTASVPVGDILKAIHDGQYDEKSQTPNKGDAPK